MIERRRRARASRQAFSVMSGSAPTGNMRSIGVWTLSAYQWTGKATASGVMPYIGGVAFNHLPLGTPIYIAGYGNFIVNDRCGISSRCDIYLGDVGACYQFGIRSAEIFVYE